MRRYIFLLVALVCPVAAQAACPLTKPIVTKWTCDNYYPSGEQWSCFGVTAESNNPIVVTSDINELQEYFWYFAVHEGGVIKEITLNPTGSSPNPQVRTISVNVSSSKTAEGCFEVAYTIQGVKDNPVVPTVCEENPLAPASCNSRINASFPAESTGWQVVDLAGHMSDETIGAPCVTQGPPFNVANRGARCTQASGVVVGGGR